MFRIHGGAYFRTNLNWFAHNIWMPKSNFKLVVQKFVRCFINCVKFQEIQLSLSPSKRLPNLYFSKSELIFLRKVLILNLCGHA